MSRALAVLSIAVIVACGLPALGQAPAKSAPGKADPKTPAKPDDKAEYVSFPTIGVKLTRPKGFTDAESFTGFALEEALSSVMASTIPGPYAKIAGGMTPERLKTAGMRQISREEFAVEGLDGVLLNIAQTARGIDIEKWMLIFGDDKKTTMITGAFPVAKKDELSALIKASVTSAKILNVPVPPPGSDLPYTLVASDKLKITPGMAKVLMYTKEGTIPAKRVEDPMFMLAPSLGKVEIPDERAYAEKRLTQLPKMKLKKISSTKAITVDGLSGFESEAEATDADSAAAMTLYQVMLFDEGKYVLMVGMVGSKESETYLPEFKAMARSFRLKAK